MGDLISNLALGFSVILSIHNFFLCLIGVLVGTLVGVLPGVGPLPTIAMLLPLTFGLSPVGGLVMLAGIFYGAQYGGSTTSILINIPGEASSVVTTIDGHQMARNGEAGPALAISAIGSFLAGCVSTVVIAAIGAPLSNVALMFGPAEYVSLMLLGLVFAVVLARGSVLKAVAMVLFGLLMAMVGLDTETGMQRMTFGFPELYDGLDFSVVALGVFGLAEILSNLGVSENRSFVRGKISGLIPTLEHLKRSLWPIGRGTLIGSFLGVLPGGGATIASFASYGLEKRIAKDPSLFGKGAIEGVAGPESANNAAAQTSFIPMLTLGIPSNAVMALLVGAMTVHGITPGPLVLVKQPELFWGLVASMWVGNLVLLIINLPLIGIWVRMLRVPYETLYPAIVLFSCIGVYSVRNSSLDVIMTGCFAAIGYFLRKCDFEAAPMLLGLVLGVLLEENLRRAYVVSRGNIETFVTSPVSALFLVLAAVLLITSLLPLIRERREQAFKE